MKDEYFIALGKIVFYFSCLELQLKQLFFIVSSKDYPASKIDIAELNFSKFLDLIKDTAKQKFTTNSLVFQKIQEVVVIAKKVNKKRNDIIHSFWLIDGLDAEKTLYKYRMKKENINPFEGEIKHISAGEIEDIAIEIRSVFYLTADLYFKLKNKTE